MTHHFRSKLEQRVWAEITEVQPDAQFETLKLPYTLSHTYTPDIILPNGVILEVKGRFIVKGVDCRNKMLAVKKAFPELDIRFIFHSPDYKLSPKSKFTYSDWCDKHGFPWCAASSIPTEWLL